MRFLMLDLLAFLTLGFVTSAPRAAATEPIHVAWAELSRPWTLRLVEQYLVSGNPEPLQLGEAHALDPDEIEESPYEGKDKAMSKLASRFHFPVISPADAATFITTEIPNDARSGPNPLGLAPKDFFVGEYLPWPLGTKAGPAPALGAADLSWYADQVSRRNAPDVFVIAGHHVIGEGFHNSEETRFLFEPTLLAAAASDANVRAYFDQVKIAILWGCNSLTDLEPHHADGSVMSSVEIASVYGSGADGRKKILGTPRIENSMEFYKSRLAREYGRGSAEYAYTRAASAEKCLGPTPFEDCTVANLERILPDSGLFDGSHRFNEPLLMSQLFRRAYVVLGFSSASPSEELRVQMLQETVRRAQQDLHLRSRSVFAVILDPATLDSERRVAIVALRKAWEITSYRTNRHRPSGSITPAYPDLDQGLVMNQRQTKQPQLNARYR